MKRIWIWLALLAAVYGAVYGLMFWLERSRPLPEKQHLDISNKAALAAFVMAGTGFVVSNLLFLGESPATMNVFCIRTLVDFCGVLILTLQHEQLRESALHQELSAMDNVLHRQYEQYKRSKEGIELINSRYHELKVQIADIRAQRDRAKQDAALAKMENSILQYEAENKTGNPVLDILLTAKSMECQEKQIRMTSVADGHLLDHLSTREICTLVGTALDNAIESCAAEQDPEKRLIRTAVYAQNGFVLFRVENYCQKPVELGADGLPLRSAHGGYDLRSLRAAAQQHGGSMTVQQMGLDQALRARGQQVFWHWGVPAEEANEMRKKAATADTYLCSANALTMDGKIVNIDGFGNRLAATLHGTGKVYMIVGKNKLAENLDAAIARIKNVSCPANAKRLGLKTPCAVLGHCTDCSSPQRMCRATLIFDRKPNAHPIDILLVDEELGF